MPRLSEQQINNIYLRCNAAPLAQLLELCLDPESGITVDGLRAVHYNKIDQLEQQYNAQAEEIIWARSQSSIEALTSFIEKCQQGIFSTAHLAQAKDKRKELAAAVEEDDWNTTKLSNDLNSLNSYIKKCMDGTYSEVHVQELGPESSTRVSLGGPAAIPRWRIINGDTVLIYVTSAGVNRKDDFWKEQSTYMVSFKDGAFGMPQKILEGNYHGGISDDMRLAVTGAHFLRVHTKIQGEERDTIWYDSSQICNVSLSTDGSLRTIFLDLGAERGRIFSGEDYLAHHRILVADSVGNLIGSIPSPEPYSFDQPEWVFGSDFLLTAMKTSDVHETVLLVDIRDSSVHSLVSGSDLWHPDVWLQP